MHSSPFSGRVDPCAPPLWSLTKDQKDLPRDNADVKGVSGGRASGWQGARQAYMAIQPRHTTTTPDLPTTTPTPPLPVCSISLHCWSHLTTKCSRSQPMPCRWWPALYHNSSPHTKPYPHSQERFHLSLALPSITLLILPKSHAPLRMGFVWGLFWIFFCLFCSQFLFSWLSFLLAGSLGNSGPQTPDWIELHSRNGPWTHECYFEVMNLYVDSKFRNSCDCYYYYYVLSCLNFFDFFCYGTFWDLLFLAGSTFNIFFSWMLLCEDIQFPHLGVCCLNTITSLSLWFLFVQRIQYLLLRFGVFSHYQLSTMCAHWFSGVLNSHILVYVGLILLHVYTSDFIWLRRYAQWWRNHSPNATNRVL